MRLLEWYLGIPPARSGQGTDWGLRTEPAWDGLLPGWMILLLTMLIVGGVVAVYLRDARSLSWPRRTLLVGLRLMSMAVLLLMLGRVLLTVTRTGMPTLALLIDTSASMGLEDRYSTDDAAAAVRRLSRASGPNPTSRLSIAQSLLTQDDERYLRELSESHRLKLYQFSQSATAVEVNTPEDGDPITPLAETINRLQPLGHETRPAAAVRQVLDDLRGSSPTALILLTDGIPTTGSEERLTAAIDVARDRSVPLIPIGIGSDEPARDLQLYDILADDVVFADDPVTFAFKLKSFGYEGKSARVSLREQGGRGNLQTIDVEIGDDGHPLPAEITLTPADAGEFDYVIEATPLPGETNTENNRVTHRLQVRREQLRVLLVERLPRWEYRHLKPVLERDPAIELHTVLQQADVSFADEDRTALPRFPVSRDALLEYDVVIWGDVDLTYLSPGALDHLQEFVAERGGGLVLLAGAENCPHEYAGTPLEDLLPVMIPDAETVRNTLPIGPSGFRLELTVEGRTRAALRLASSAEENERLWRRLPPLYWLQTSGRRKPAAQVLAVHPTRHGDGGPLPVIVLQRFGAGQVLYHATDEFWQWRQRVEDRYYGRYWLQMVRYLSRSKLRSDVRGIELSSDRSVYQQGEGIELRARFLDPQTIPTTDDGAKAIVEGPGGRRETVIMQRMTEAPNVFIGRATGLAAGSYHAWLAELPPLSTSPDAEGDDAAPTAVPSADFRVEVSDSELRDRAFRQADLIEAAKGSRGAYYPFWDADRLLDEVPRGRSVPVSSEMRIPLWNRWELLILLTGLLAAEWIARKRSGLV